MENQILGVDIDYYKNRFCCPGRSFVRRSLLSLCQKNTHEFAGQFIGIRRLNFYRRSYRNRIRKGFWLVALDITDMIC